ncbi:hypothetical protein NQ317_019346 [Molorchus minor]|uniref:inositol-phosphate phosphatase n=1 Tax=Molorchus minor TaxID=1323400 RepID=A0ABQ9J8W1_9CUCU|nr:hypothetical protein NQ317_019346 [Molorchus minor]
MNLGGVIHINKKGICGLGLLLIILLLYYNKDTALDTIKPKTINLYKLLNVAIKAAENGGKEVVRVKDNIEIKTKGLTKEGQVDSVTTADFLSHCSMTKTLKHFFPTLKVISEEAKATCDINQSIDYSLQDVDKSLLDEYVQEEDITVWIDPLDATQEYTEKLFNYVTTMVCVAVKEKPVLGIIHKPFNTTTSWAWVHKMTSKDLTQSEGHKNTKHDGPLKVVVSRSHSGQIQEVLKKNFNKDFQLISAAGAGYKTLQVATGIVDAYLHITVIKKWDICAGNAILDALGGKMSTKFNKDIDYSSNSEVINSDGLIATMEDHKMFLGIL